MLLLLLHMQINQLHSNANYVRRRLQDMGLHVLGDWDSPVMPIMIYHAGKLPVFSRLTLRVGGGFVPRRLLQGVVWAQGLFPFPAYALRAAQPA